CGTFYSQTAKAEYTRAGRFATQLVLNRAKPVQIRLKDWFARLPAECKMDNLTTGQLSSTGYLHLGYFATEISIHRRIVQSLDPATADPYMLYICRSAAKTRLISAMDFVNRLRPEHLDAFWYFASATNFALVGTFGALLLATSPGKEEAEFYASRLSEFKWTLKVS
ncbi:Fungal specific transcription factor, partial [Teratosphaeriaceae sp. CCFEE 6253]